MKKIYLFLLVFVVALVGAGIGLFVTTNDDDDNGNDNDADAVMPALPEEGEAAFSDFMSDADYTVIAVAEMDFASMVRHVTGRDVSEEELALLREGAMAESAGWCIKIDPAEPATNPRYILAYDGESWTVTPADDEERPLWEEACGQPW